MMESGILHFTAVVLYTLTNHETQKYRHFNKQDTLCYPNAIYMYVCLQWTPHFPLSRIREVPLYTCTYVPYVHKQFQSVS